MIANTSWPVKTLGDVCEVLDSLRRPITKRDRTSGDYPYYGATGIVDYVGDYIFDERLVLVGEDGAKWDAGDRTAFVVEGKYWVNNHAHVLRCKQGVLVDGWLANFLTMSDLNTYVSGLTVPKLNQGSLVSIEIPVPPLKEQKRIVALLDAATARVTELTACYEQARTHANNLFTSALRDVLEGNPDWPVKTLGQVCSIESVLVDPRDPKYSRMSHIGAGNIEAGTGRVFDIKTASEENLISGKYLFTKNDVLYSKIRPYLVKVATPETAGLCSADVYPLQPGPLLTRMFLFYSLISETFTEYAISGSSRTGMPKVNREHLFKYQLRIPPTATQSEIVSRLEALRAKTSEMVAAYDAKLAAAKNLRQSILEAAFGGDL